MFRFCQIIIRELLFLAKVILQYSQFNSFCKQVVVAACHVVWECVVERAVG